MNRSRVSRRNFLRGTLATAGTAIAVTPALLVAKNTAPGGQQMTSGIPAEDCGGGRLEEASKGYKPRFPGPRWHLVYGSYEGVEQFALDELQRAVQSYLPYVVQVRDAREPLDPVANHILIGTLANNSKLAELHDRGTLQSPARPEGYSSASFASPGNHDRKTVAIAGTDPAGVLYGVIDFNRRLARSTSDDSRGMRPTLDSLADFTTQANPSIQGRGIWSWGYVIYDYRRFLDNMARLKMNRLVFWVDVPPINCEEIIRYAHSRGIKVVLGFSWGYDLNTLDPTSHADLELIKADVLCQLAHHYQHLGMDAIYFQNFTETTRLEVGGKPIAVLARDWVNDIGAAVLQRYPEMKLEWGLHASSILQNYKDLIGLDPRISIVWEDAGVIPYSYDPETSNKDFPAMLNSPEATLAFSKQLATFRQGSEFAMVAKGWIQMRWQTEFEHHGPFIMGEQEASYIRDRLEQRQARWDFVNNLWLQNYPLAIKFFAGLRGCTSAPINVTGLIEDGLFEEKIQPSAALFAEMIWNPNRSAQEILVEAFSAMGEVAANSSA